MIQPSDAQKVLIVIPALNEAKHIAAVMQSILQDCDESSVLMVVADGGSSDGTPNIVSDFAKEHPAVRLIDNPDRIQSAAINRAVLQFGQGRDILIRCDAHAGYPRNFVNDLVATLERTNADSVVVPMDTIGHSCVQKAIAWASNSAVGTGGSAHRGGRKSGYVDHGHHAAMRLSKFREVGGYNATFTHNEDAELDYRLKGFDAKIYLDADIRLQYEPRPTLLRLWKQYFNYGYGRLRTVTRHPASLRLRQFAVPINLALLVFSVLAAAITPLFLVWPAFYLTVLLLASIHPAVKKRDACALLVGPAAFVMHISWALGFFSAAMVARETLWQKQEQRPLL